MKLAERHISRFFPRRWDEQVRNIITGTRPKIELGTSRVQMRSITVHSLSLCSAEHSRVVKVSANHCLSSQTVSSDCSSTFFRCVLHTQEIRNSAVNIATGYGLDGRRIGVQVPVGARIFSTSLRQFLGPTQPPVQWVPEAHSPG
jgi:hypothetical protein